MPYQNTAKKKFHIAVDMDDVVLDFFPAVLDTFYKEFGERPEFDGAPWGENAKAFYRHERLLDAGYHTWWDWLRERDWLWSTFPAVPGAIGGIKTLRSRGHYMELVTSKPEWAEFNVWKWLGKWRPPFNQVTVVSTGHEKIDYTDADIIVDDKLDTVLSFVDSYRQAIWFERSRKQIAQMPVRVAWHWDHVIEHVLEMELDA